MSLSHRYDAVKAHEYYMRNRKLKGRKKGRGLGARKVSSKATKVSLGEQAGLRWAKGKTDKQLERAIVQLNRSAKNRANPLTPGIMKAYARRMAAKRAEAAPTQPDNQKPTQAPQEDQVAKQKAQAAAQALNQMVKRKAMLEKKTAQAAAAKEVVSIQKELNDLNAKLKTKLAAVQKAAAKAKQGLTAAEKSDAAREAKKYRDEHKQEIKTKQAAAKESSGSKQASSTAADTIDTLKARITDAQNRLRAAVAKQRALA